ncbi:hypothetical protein D9756_009589 [Leucocoprinus leucothites]|uniref:Uncharacterized protein n=1 Tax=Leucocoprinus leucothites TaxID=201217 RepID=A0A8H5CWX4_9AGAR|nr:hypothetical protein D9756_009589 [Leucoagaricus leucothites]
MSLLPRPILGSTDDFIRLHKRYDSTVTSSQPPEHPQADVQPTGTTLPSEDSLNHMIDSIQALLLIILIIAGTVSLTYLAFRKLFREGFQTSEEQAQSKKPTSNPGLPSDPYLTCTNTSLDASLVAATEPSFKHTTIPPRAHCAFNRKPDTYSGGEPFQWCTCSTAGPGPNTACYPGVIWDPSSLYSTSTPNGSCRGHPLEKEKRLSSPPAYPQGEGLVNTIEKEPASKP